MSAQGTAIGSPTRYRVTDHRLRTAMLITRVHDRLLPHQADTNTGIGFKPHQRSINEHSTPLAEQNGLAA